MKKIILVLMTGLLMIPAVLLNVSAAPANYDVISCDLNTSAFTVDVLSVSGGNVLYDSKACYDVNQYFTAIEKMNELKNEGHKDVVVRYLRNDVSSFYSPLKIVAATRAMAYSRNETYHLQSTMDIHSTTALNSRVNYIDNNEPLNYFETNHRDYNNYRPNNLVAYIGINGQYGYVPITNIDIIPFIYVENRILTPYYVRESYNAPLTLYHRTGRGPGIVPEPVSYKVSNGEITISIDRAISGASLLYAKAPSWLPNGTYYSVDGIHFYTDLDLKSPVMNGSSVGEYYSYYEYLNFRSKTNYTGTELNNFMNQTTHAATSVMTNNGDVFINGQNKYGMNALLFYAFAIHESAYGTSAFARERFNLFGYGAVDSNPGNAASYTSLQDGVDRHMAIQMRYYFDYTNENLFYATNLGNAGSGIHTRYASDPYWNVKIAGHAYRIDKQLGSKDIDYYQLAIVNDNAKTLYKDRGLTSSLVTLLNRVNNYPIILNNVLNNSYQFNTSNPLDSNGNLITRSNTNPIDYNFDNHVAYIHKDNIKLVNTGRKVVTDLTPPVIIDGVDKLSMYVSLFEWTENMLYIKGWAALENTNMSDNVAHQLKVIDLSNEGNIYLIDLNVSEPLYPLSLGNGLNYDKAWFDGIIDVSTLPEGDYRFEIKTVSGNVTGESVIYNSVLNAPKPIPVNIGSRSYRLHFNNTRRMRYELSISSGIDFTGISLYPPTRFMSLSYVTQFTVNEDEAGKDILSIEGVSIIHQAQMGPENNVSHQLLMVNPSGNSYTFSLTAHTGSYDLSIEGYNYTHAWFSGNSIPIDDLPNNTYQMYIITSNLEFTDIVEIRDMLVKGTQAIESSDKVYSLVTNTAVRRRYELKISSK